jgi:integrase
VPKLTAAFVRAAKCPPLSRRPVRFGDRDGLYLQVAPGDTKSWLFRFTLCGKAREMGLGPYGEPPGGVPLAEARKLAGEARALLRDGRDPIVERQDRKAALHRARLEASERTFRAAAEAFVKTRAVGWKNEKHGAQWTATLEQHVFPMIGDMAVAKIDTDDVLRVLRPIWERVPETASRVRQRMEAVLDAAKVKGWRAGENPARWRGHLAGELPAPAKVKRVAHRPALPWQQMAMFMGSLAQRQGMAAKAIRFTILTAARTGEVRGMRWREVDLEAKVWTIPGDRMKAGRTHRVPLPSSSLAVLEEVRPLMKSLGDLVFPSTNGKAPLSDMALSMLVRGMAHDGLSDGDLPRWRDGEGRAVVPHGFRSSFRDWAGETRNDGHDVVEAALAHTIKNKSEAAYARSDLLEKRRVLMNAWGEHCTGQSGDVVNLATRRAASG